jgi:rfaE bifunctional protein kinase chain/domain
MTTTDILDGISRLSALIVGDICIDRWCTYDPAAAEPSRETGLPRIGVVTTEVSPGAGGTVANNIAALGASNVSVLGVIGKDGYGHELTRALKLRHIDTDLLVKVDDLSTFTYTKLINSETGIEDRPRVDFISTRALARPVEKILIERLRAWASRFDLIIVADQAETEQGGVVTPAMREVIADIATQHPEKAIWVDSRKRCDLFRRVVLKPNQLEADAACQRLIGERDYTRLRQALESRLMIVTFASEGALVVHQLGETWVKTKPVEKPVDICGAGDSFTAGAAAALALTGSPVAAAKFGNIIAGITIMKKGTGVASRSEVLEAAPSEDFR